MDGNCNPTCAQRTKTATISYWCRNQTVFYAWEQPILGFKSLQSEAEDSGLISAGNECEWIHSFIKM